MDMYWSLIALQVGMVVAFVVTFWIVWCERCVLWLQEHTGIADASIQKMGISYYPEQTTHMYRVLGKYIKNLETANRLVGLVCYPEQGVEQDVRGLALFEIIDDQAVDLFCRNSHRMIYLITVDRHEGDKLMNMWLPSNVRWRSFDQPPVTRNLIYTPLHRFEI